MERLYKAFLIFSLFASCRVCVAQGTFTATGSMTVPRAGHTATLLADGRVLIAGGSTAELAGSAATVVSRAELYVPSTGTFSRTGSMTTGRQGHTATLLGDGKVLIAGGASFPPYAPHNSAELYIPLPEHLLRPAQCSSRAPGMWPPYSRTARSWLPVAGLILPAQRSMILCPARSLRPRTCTSLSC